MRTISATLQTAARSTSASPYLRIRAIKKIAGIGRLDWTRLYTGPEAEVPHCAIQPADGSLIRFKALASIAQINRVASPGPTSDFATYGTLGGTDVNLVAIASSGPFVIAFYADSTGQILCKTGGNYGATWNATWSTVAPPGTAPTVMAAAAKSTTDILLIFNRGATVYKTRSTDAGATWPAEAPWSNSAASITGLALFYSGDYNAVITGTEITTTHPKVWTCLYGDGFGQPANTWSTLAELASASSGSNVSYQRPSLAQPDAFRLFFVERYTGATAYSRPHFSHTTLTSTFVDNLWREPVPFNLDIQEGLAIAYGAGDYVWLSSPSGVWRAPLVQGTGLDLSADVLSATIHCSPTTGHALITLRNDNATYASPGSGSIANLQRGSQLDIAPGYKTTAGTEVSSGPAFWIESLQHIATPGKAQLVITAIDGWGLLRSWSARRQHTWTAGSRTIYQLIAWALARAGLELAATATGPSPACTSLQPDFTIHPGATGAQTILRLLAKVPDLIFFRGATAYIFQPTTAQATTYPYGTAHPILEGAYLTASYQSNQAQVYGNGVTSEDLNWTEIELHYNRTRHIIDLGLSAAPDTTARAQAELRDQTINSRHDTITTRPHPGQELHDVVDVTDPRANLSAALRRVLALDLTLDTPKGAFTQTLTLGAP